jgi:hypothetical protein
MAFCIFNYSLSFLKVSTGGSWQKPTDCQSYCKQLYIIEFATPPEYRGKTLTAGGADILTGSGPAVYNNKKAALRAAESRIQNPE